jgi:hypothetical protein
MLGIGKLKDFLTTRTDVIGEEFGDLKLRLQALEEDVKQVPELAEQVQNVNKMLDTQTNLASELKALEQWVVPRVVKLEKEIMVLSPTVSEMNQKLDALEAVVDMSELTQPGRERLETQKVTETPGLDGSSSTDSTSGNDIPRKNAAPTSDSRNGAPKHDTPKHGQTKPRDHESSRQDDHSELPPTQNCGPKNGEERIRRGIERLTRREEGHQGQHHRLDQQQPGNVHDVIRQHKSLLDAERAVDKRRHDELQLERRHCQEDFERAQLAEEVEPCRQEEEEQHQQRLLDEDDQEGQRLFDEFLREIKKQMKRQEESERRQEEVVVVEEKQRSGGFLGQMASTILGLGIGGLSIYMNGALGVLKPFVQ